MKILIEIVAKLVGAYVFAGGSYYLVKRCWPELTKDFWLLVGLLWIVTLTASLVSKASWSPLPPFVIRSSGALIIGGLLYYFGKRKFNLVDKFEIALFATAYPVFRILLAVLLLDK